MRCQRVGMPLLTAVIDTHIKCLPHNAPRRTAMPPSTHARMHSSERFLTAASCRSRACVCARMRVWPLGRRSRCVADSHACGPWHSRPDTPPCARARVSVRLYACACVCTCACVRACVLCQLGAPERSCCRRRCCEQCTVTSDGPTAIARMTPQRWHGVVSACRCTRACKPQAAVVVQRINSC